MKLSAFGPSQRALLNTFGNALFTGCTWPSGHHSSGFAQLLFHFRERRNQGRFPPLHRERICGIAAGRCSLGHEQFHFAISEGQFKMIDMGAALGWSTLVLIRNFWPSPLKS